MALGPIAAAAYRMGIRNTLIAGGMGALKALEQCNFNTLPPDILELALGEAANATGTTTPTLPAETLAAGEMGASTGVLAQIFAAISAFLQTPQGQALFAALVQLLLGLIPK